MHGPLNVKLMNSSKAAHILWIYTRHMRLDQLCSMAILTSVYRKSCCSLVTETVRTRWQRLNPRHCWELRPTCAVSSHRSNTRENKFRIYRYINYTTFQLTLNNTKTKINLKYTVRFRSYRAVNTPCWLWKHSPNYVHSALVCVRFTPFCFKAHCQFTPPLNLHSLIFSLTSCGWLLAVTLSPCF